MESGNKKAKKSITKLNGSRRLARIAAEHPENTPANMAAARAMPKAEKLRTSAVIIENTTATTIRARGSTRLTPPKRFATLAVWIRYDTIVFEYECFVERERKKSHSRLRP